jgi:hypothetical protein
MRLLNVVRSRRWWKNETKNTFELTHCNPPSVGHLCLHGRCTGHDQFWGRDISPILSLAWSAMFFFSRGKFHDSNAIQTKELH